jgi:hypothetical protein
VSATKRPLLNTDIILQAAGFTAGHAPRNCMANYVFDEAPQRVLLKNVRNLRGSGGRGNDQ